MTRRPPPESSSLPLPEEETGTPTAGHSTGFEAARYSSHPGFIERRSLGEPLYQVDDRNFTSSIVRPTHWSIAWSDLMMTMFVLFLSMFAYQLAHEQFLEKQRPEIIGGDTTEALRTLDSSGASFPFAPIHPGLPLMTGGTIRQVEKVKLEELDPDTVYPAEGIPAGQHPEAVDQPDSSVGEERPTPAPAPSEPVATSPPVESQPAGAPAGVDPVPGAGQDQFQEIYALSKDALESNDLDKFAAIDLVPDKTMRIILTGDLLFEIGESELSEAAKASLQKVVAVIHRTPYMINVVGHTDNLPMHSGRFPSNWELSLSRASTVVRFLIDEMGMDPNQFVVSGYSSYRPVVPNVTAENRAKNRRVEIIISKRLPNPLPATADNLQ